MVYFWPGESWCGSIWLHSQTGDQSRLVQQQEGPEEADEENPL